MANGSSDEEECEKDFSEKKRRIHTHNSENAFWGPKKTKPIFFLFLHWRVTSLSLSFPWQPHDWKNAASNWKNVAKWPTSERSEQKMPSTHTQTRYNEMCINSRSKAWMCVREHYDSDFFFFLRYRASCMTKFSSILLPIKDGEETSARSLTRMNASNKAKER